MSTPSRYQGALRLFVLLLLIGPAACSDDGSATPKGDTGNAAQDASSSGTLLDEFCTESVKACTTVTLPQCKKIVTDANKIINTVDIACAKAAKTCADTSACLDSMSLPQPDAGGGPDQGPTTRPAP